MTNAIVALQKGDIELSDVETMIMEEAARDETAFDPIPTKIVIAPGGINVFSTSDGETLNTLSGIIAISQKARAYWPDKGTGSPPLCSSRDGLFGTLAPEYTNEQLQAAANARIPHPALPRIDAGADLPARFECMSCPMAQWGSAYQSGKASKAQACKSLRRLVLVLDGWTQPALFTLPPTSLRNFDTYASGLQRRRSAYFAVRTEIGLEKQTSGTGEPYSIATFKMVEELQDKQQLAAVIALRDEYKELVAQMDISPDEYDAPVEAPAADEDIPL